MKCLVSSALIFLSSFFKASTALSCLSDCMRSKSPTARLAIASTACLCMRASSVSNIDTSRARPPRIATSALFSSLPIIALPIAPAAWPLIALLEDFIHLTSSGITWSISICFLLTAQSYTAAHKALHVCVRTSLLFAPRHSFSLGIPPSSFSRILQGMWKHMLQMAAAADATTRRLGESSRATKASSASISSNRAAVASSFTQRLQMAVAAYIWSFLSLVDNITTKPVSRSTLDLALARNSA
mmetsp:Transcript_29716/g.68810  ORF Transcript_29716/g.68810 Transcript_29716/m.68810 type:complete len:243 (+) Transcript_29716:95-823(+)